MKLINRIDHLAVVVEDIEASLVFWRDAMGLDVSDLKDVPEESARVAFLPVGDSKIELVQPTDAGTGLARYLAKRGSGMHHICLEVSDIESMLSSLKEKGVRLINEQPRVEAGGVKYAFIHPESTQGVLVELYER